MAASSSGGDLGGGGADDSSLLAHSGACTTCRRKKQRCSREDPACRSCAASGSICVYEEGQRRGAKAGYVEALVRRMDTLEALVLGQSMLLAPTLARESRNGPDPEADPDEASNLEGHLRVVRENLLLLRPRKRRRSGSEDRDSDSDGSPAPIPRVQPQPQPQPGPGPASGRVHSVQEQAMTGTCQCNCHNQNHSHTNDNTHLNRTPTGAQQPYVSGGSETQDNILPPPAMLRQLVDLYFERIHPWIPILHRPSFEAAMMRAGYGPSASDSEGYDYSHGEGVGGGGGQPQLPPPPPSVTVLQAITAATVKFYRMDQPMQEWYHRRCHDAVVLTCMDRFSVESLQASIIIAFNTIGSGRGPRSWSIVASATRIVEQLGLAVEPAEEEEDGPGRESGDTGPSRIRGRARGRADRTLLSRIGFLTPARTWTEAESLRRIFWCIFLLDRFCSVATGWNTSLTSTDVRRRLPVEGCLWRDGVEKKGRYFDISGGGTGAGDAASADESETEVLGGFAYLVEAAECLTRVATFLLRESADIFSGSGLTSSSVSSAPGPTSGSGSSGLRRWFERFQALDSMLVRWKTFLPARWQVAGLDAAGRMDENLTLAHVMHNASVIMLHQNMAFPDSRFRHPGLLPLPAHEDAGRTCVAAAGEIATIAAQFVIASRPRGIVIPPAFSFCLFVAARALLAHAAHAALPAVHPSFHVLLQALRDASARWRAEGPAFASENLAGQFADRLDAALRSRSPIDVRSAALQEEDDQLGSNAGPIMGAGAGMAEQGYGHQLPPVMLSLASPPFPDVFRFSAAYSPDGFDPGSMGGDVYSMPNVNLDAFDRIFTWTDEMTG